MTLGTERMAPMTTVRLWDQDMTLLATEDGYPDADHRAPGALEFTVTIRGEGALHTALCDVMRNGSILDGNVYLSVDSESTSVWRPRTAGTVTKIAVENRPCECGENKVVVTTVHASPHRLAAIEWPTP